jgi:transposase
VAAQGNAGINELRAIVAEERDTRLPIDARASVIVLTAQLEALECVIGAIEKRIKMQHRSNEASQRVETLHSIRRRSQRSTSDAAVNLMSATLYSMI